MLKLIILVTTAVGMQAKAAVAISEHDEKSGKPCVEQAKACTQADNIEKLNKVIKDGGQLPPELSLIVASYDGRLNDIADVERAAQEMLNALQEVNMRVKEKMLTQAQLRRQLSQKNNDVTLAAMRKQVLNTLLRKIVTPEQVQKWERLRSLCENVIHELIKDYKPAIDDYQKMQVETRMLPALPGELWSGVWANAGFKYAPLEWQTVRMVCNGCKAEVCCIQPWMQPQYYHKPQCKAFTAVAADPRFKIVAYGENIPKDPEAYWEYTMGFLDRYSRLESVDPKLPNNDIARSFQNMLTQCFTVADWVVAAEYCKVYDAHLPAKNRKAWYKSVLESSLYFHKIWDLGSQK